MHPRPDVRPKAEWVEEQVRRVLPLVEAGQGLLVDTAESEEGVLRGKEAASQTHFSERMSEK